MYKCNFHVSGIFSKVVISFFVQMQEIWDQKYVHRDELYLILSRFLQNIYLKYV